MSRRRRVETGTTDQVLQGEDPRLIEAYRVKGRRDGRDGLYDQWSFEQLPPPLIELRHRRDQVIAETGWRSLEEQQTGMAHSREVIEVAEGQLNRLEPEAVEAAREMMRVRRKMDRQAMIESYRRNLAHPEQDEDELTDPDAIWTHDAYLIEDGEPATGTGTAAETRDAAADAAADPTADRDPVDWDPVDPVDPLDTPDTTAAAGTAAGADGDDPDAGRPAVRAPGTLERWEGPHTPSIPRSIRYLILGVLTAVEVPIQAVIFNYFHGSDTRGLLLTAVFTASVATVTILAPHALGIWFRGRRATGSEPGLSRMVLALMLVLGVAVAILGLLRQKVMVTPVEIPAEDGTVLRLPPRSEALGLSPLTLTCLFVALLILTGGISFLLGVAREHPWQAAFLTYRRRRDELHHEMDELAALSRRHRQQIRDRADPGSRGEHDRAVAARITAFYAVVASAYLDGVKDGMKDPAATGAIGVLAARLRLEGSAGGQEAVST